jgi:hypothetical protein
VWAGIIQRCTNPKSPNWPYYGGRGITVCERWRDFADFESDMAPRPSMQHTIERKDVDGPYSPDNCTWATRVEQGRNRRCVQIFDIDDKPLGLLAMAKHLAMHETALRRHLIKSGVLHAR